MLNPQNKARRCPFGNQTPRYPRAAQEVTLKVWLQDVIHVAVSIQVSLMATGGTGSWCLLPPDHIRWSSILISFKDTSSEHASSGSMIVFIHPWHFDICAKLNISVPF